MLEENDFILASNAKKLKVGNIIRNYLFMCDLLGEDIKVGNSKKSQINNWKRFFECELIGHKYKIIKVYDFPLERVIQKGGNNKKYYVQYCVNQIYNIYVGVYSITKDNQIYIGSTTVGFRHRFLQHMCRDTKTTELLLDGGTFQIVLSLKEGNESEIRSKENYYIIYIKMIVNIF